MALDTPLVPAAAAEPPLLGHIGLDLPAKPDGAAAQLSDRGGEVRVPPPAQRQGGPADAGKLGSLGQPDQIERENGRRLFCRFGSYWSSPVSVDRV